MANAQHEMARIERGDHQRATGVIAHQATVDALNEHNGVTKRQAAAMNGGNESGWGSIAANPGNYDIEGRMVADQEITEWDGVDY